MSRKILVVDDSSTIRALQSYILESEGFETATATNGVDALEKIYSGRYDMVIADINMPKMDGLRLIKTLREQEEYKKLPIIIVTSESDESDRMRGIDAGADVYLVKPTDPESLVQNVNMLLGS